MPLMVDMRQGRGFYHGHNSKFIASDGGRGKRGCSGRGHGRGAFSFTLYLGISNKFEWNNCRH